MSTFNLELYKNITAKSVKVWRPPNETVIFLLICSCFKPRCSHAEVPQHGTRTSCSFSPSFQSQNQRRLEVNKMLVSIHCDTQNSWNCFYKSLAWETCARINLKLILESLTLGTSGTKVCVSTVFILHFNPLTIQHLWYDLI